MSEHLTPDVLVVGSLNLDVRWAVPHLPSAGETVLADGSERGLGGKGANQAVAVRALGVHARLVAAVGDDPAADWLLDELAELGVDTDTVVRTKGETGQAQVVVDSASGENLIVVAAGSNAALSPAHVERALFTSTARMVIAQQEVPADTVALALRRSQATGRFTVLNAAPTRPLSDAVLACVDLLVVNEGEALSLAGCDAAHDAAARLRARGASAVMVSLGAAGVLVDDGTGSAAELVEAPTVASVIDTTGAGDVLTGAVAAALVRGRSLRAAAQIGVQAASWSVQHAGVRAPRPRDLDLAW